MHFHADESTDEVVCLLYHFLLSAAHTVYLPLKEHIFTGKDSSFSTLFFSLRLLRPIEHTS